MIDDILRWIVFLLADVLAYLAIGVWDRGGAEASWRSADDSRWN